MKESELVLIYDVRQVPELERFLSGHGADASRLVVVAFDAEIDMCLRGKGIPFLSARDYRTKGTEHFLFAEGWLSFLEQPAWSWFRYRDILFGKLFYTVLQSYIRQVIYYVDIIMRVCDTKRGFVRITVLAPTQEIPQAGTYITKRLISVVVDSAQLVGKQREIDVAVYKGQDGVRENGSTHEHAQKNIFVLKRAVFGLGLSVLNIGANLLRARGTVRILASDYWRNIAPILENLPPRTEVMLCDRKEVFNARLRNVWRYRMRFVGLDSYGVRGRSVARSEALHALEEDWGKIRSRTPDTMHIGDISLKPLFLEVFEEVMHDWLPAILKKIDELYALVDALHPDIVLLRATVSLQWHFPLLALIARARGIPSLELLHGMEYPGPGSTDKRHVAEYIGVYGLHTKRQLQHEGFEAENLPIIGSPRFDLYELKQYAQLRNLRSEGSSHPVIFCTTPDLFLGVTFDTYDIVEYFSSIARAVRGVPGVTIIIKLRPGRYRETFYRQTIARTFAGISHTIAQFEQLEDLFPKVDLAVSCQSTVTLEALQCGVPLVLFASTPVDALELRYNFTDLAEKGAVALCLDVDALVATLPRIAQDENLRKKLSTAAETFLDREFAFDGRASERAAALITELASSKSQ